MTATLNEPSKVKNPVAGETGGSAAWRPIAGCLRSQKGGRLEQRGLVMRQPDPDDRRGTRVRLTSAGLELIDEVVASHVQLEATYLSALSDAQQRKLEELLTLLTQARGL